MSNGKIHITRVIHQVQNIGINIKDFEVGLDEIRRIANGFKKLRRVGRFNVGSGMPIFVFVFEDLNPGFIFRIKNCKNIFGHKSMFNKYKIYDSQSSLNFLKCSN